jgi:uroporphyrinogen-III synthase
MNAPLPLQGLGIVITRPRDAAETLARTLEQAGARPFVFPALAIEPIVDSPELTAALATLRTSDLAIFVSANAVEHGLAAAKRHGPWPLELKVAAIGDATARALRNSGIGSVISPRERHDSEALLALDELKAVEGRNILIFRGRGGRESLRKGLESRGAQVSYAECYRRTRPDGDPQLLLRAWERGEIHGVSIMSAETLENFISMIGEEGSSCLGRTALVVPHPAIGESAAARRFSRVMVAPADDALVGVLAALRMGA